MSKRRKSSAWLLAAVLASIAVCASQAAVAAGTARITGKVIESGTGLPLLGVTVATIGPTTAKALTDPNGNFTLEGLIPGRYELVASLNGYQTTESNFFDLSAGQSQDVALAIEPTHGVTSGIRSLGKTTIRASATLQTAAVVSSTVVAQDLVKQGVYRATAALTQLPGVNFVGAQTAAPVDEVQFDVRGLGELETRTLIDGNPVGPLFGGGFDYAVSPVFGLRAIRVLYGSGSDLYGVDAIGGVVDMQTLEPTLRPTTTFSQGYGTWDHLTTSLTSTGSVDDARYGYAVALGSEGLDGPFKHAPIYQPSAAFDPYAGSAVRALGVYPDDNAFTNKSLMLKGRLNFSDTSSLTATMLNGSVWFDKTGNGDNDYLPYEVALSNGEGQLAAAAASGGVDPCYNANHGTFMPGTNANGSTPGHGPGGVPDGPSLPVCVSPAQFAALNYGWQGAGTAWAAFRFNSYALHYEADLGKNHLSVNTFTDLALRAVSRTFQLPFINEFGDNADWHNEQSTNTGATATYDIVGRNNEFGFGYFYENSSYYFLQGSTATGGVQQPAPTFNETAYFLRDSWHPGDSPLTTYANAWFKRSTLTNTSYVDPRVAFVYTKGDNVVRLAGGETSAQPFPADIESSFQPTPVGTFLAHVGCSGFNAVGSVPSSELKPEQGVDQELSLGHRFAGDSTIQLTLYNENLFGKIYDGLNLPLSDLTVPFNPIPYANLVASTCAVSQAQAIALLGVNGSINIGHTQAGGVDLVGRVRVSRPFFIDYDWNTESSVLRSSDPSLINPAFGGTLSLVPNSQLPNVPLHKWSYAFDYTFWHNIEARLSTYHVSENNPKNLPAYGYSDLELSGPVGPGTLGATVSNIWKNDAFYEGRIGEGYPLALNSFAQPSDYQPFFGSQATERFGLPFRTIQLNYSVTVR